MVFRTTLLLLLGLGFHACSPKSQTAEETSQSEQFSQQGVSLKLAHHRKNTLSDLEYTFDLVIPAQRSEAISGTAKISFRLSNDSAQPVILDFLSPNERIRQLSANGKPAQWKPSHDHILIEATAFHDGDNTIEIEFEAGDEAFNRNPDYMYALFVPDRAHYSLPLFDQPNLKAAVTWQITAPENWQVIANGPKTEATALTSQTLHKFAKTKPMPSYLFAIAAGRFEQETASINGREFNMFHRETDVSKVARNREEIFKLHAETLAWLEDYTQIDYPFQKFDFVLIPSFQYGGMEHPGGILYREASLLLDETATQRQALGRASLIAHETAHMWFGDLVTMNWFDDVWTKEVFANFMAAKIVNPAFPDVDHELRFLTAHHPSAYGVDRTDGANQIRQPLDNLRFAGTLYGAIIYQKAPIVMRHLEKRVGEESLRDGLREYLNQYAYSNATWPDLIEILDKRTEENLQAWSEVWVSEPGRPTISVTREKGDLILAQEDPRNLSRVWPQTLNLLTGSSDSYSTITLELGAQPQRLEGLANGEFVLPNGSGLEYGNFVLDKISQTYLLEHVADFEEALVRGAIWVTLWDQLLENRLSPSAFYQSLLVAIPREQDELVLARLLSYLSTTFWKFTASESRHALSIEVETLLWNEINSDRPRSARSLFYSRYRQLAVSNAAVARLERLWRAEETIADLPLSESEQIALAGELVLRGLSNSKQILDEQRSRIENPDRLARFDFARPALSANASVRLEFFESLKAAENRNREAWVLTALGYLHHPLRAEESQELLGPALNLLSEIQATGDIFFPGRWLDVNLSGHNTAAAADIVTAFLSANHSLSPRLKLKVLQSADNLFRSAAIVDGWQP